MKLRLLSGFLLASVLAASSVEARTSSCDAKVPLPYEAWGDDAVVGLYAVAVPDNWNCRIVLWNEGAVDSFNDVHMLGDPPLVDIEAIDPTHFGADRIAFLLGSGKWQPRYFATPVPASVCPLRPGGYCGLEADILSSLFPEDPARSPDLGYHGMADRLLSEGYAIAQTWGTRRSMRTLEDFENRAEHGKRLLQHIRATVGSPEKTIAIGRSLGGTVTANLLDEYPELVDGGITLGQHPIVGGDARLTAEIPYFTAMALWYEFFPWPAHWGTPVDPCGDHACPSAYGEVIPTQTLNVTDPDNLAKFEMVRLVLSKHIDPVGFYQSSLTALYYLVYGPNYYEAFERWMGGFPIELAGVDFRRALSPEEAAYIESLDPSIDVDALLSTLNAKYGHVHAAPSARQRYERVFGMDLEKLSRPILVHNAIHADEEIPEVEHLQRRMVADAGKLDLYEQVYTSYPNGHVAANEDQILDMIRAMDAWVTTGIKPDFDDPAVLPPGHSWDRTFVPALPWWAP